MNKQGSNESTSRSVKNLPEIKYHVCVIVSRRRDLALTEFSQTWKKCLAA